MKTLKWCVTEELSGALFKSSKKDFRKLKKKAMDKES